VVGCLLTSLIVLIAGIEGIQFKPGYSLDLFDFNFTSGLPNPEGQKLIVKSLLNVTVVALILLLIGLVLLPRLWKRILKTAANVISLYIILYLVITRLNFLLKSALSSESEADSDQGAESPATALFESLQFEPSDFFVFLISSILVLGMMAGMVVLWRKTRKEEVSSPLDEFSNKAQKALDQVKSGQDLRNTIIRSYSEMSEALVQHQNIKRSEMMTPREFEKLLSQYSLPQNPIQELTHLFEEVRYGRKELGKEEEKKCIECLSAIIQACQEKNEKIKQL